jgi:dTDP-4-amino-4,6-dideoxygalactose transaminase
MPIQVPFVDLQAELAEIRAEVEPAVRAVIESAQFIMGPQVAQFEASFAEYVGARYAVGVSNGTEALKLALEAIGVGRGDEVIVPAHTFAASALAVWAAGATPRLVDCDERTHRIDATAARRAIGPRTRAIIAVHLYGGMADLEALADLGLPIIEDCAQAHGATCNGRSAGSVGIAGCFSFYPSKNLGAWGDGGCVVTSDERVHRRLLRLRNYGQSKKYHHDEKGYNCRLDTLQAAVLSVKLRRLDEGNTRRQRAAAFYSHHLRAGLQRPGPEGVFHLYPILVSNRDRLREQLAAEGIESGIHYPIPLHLSGCFADLGHREGDFPVAERIARETVSLPIYPQIRDEQLTHVVEHVNRLAESP